MIYRLIRYDVGHVDFEDKANAEKSFSAIMMNLVCS